MVKVTPGKLRGLIRLADKDGRFRMLATDQRGSLQRMIAKAKGKDKSEVTYEEMAFAKEMIVRTLAPHVSAVLIDPVYGYPHVVKLFPKDVGVLLAIEETGYIPDESKKGRKSRLIEGWSVEKIKKAGADAVKLLMYYRDEAPEGTKEHQKAIIRQVGEDCKKYDIPFLLEIVGYPVLDDEVDSSGKPTTDCETYAKRKPEIVLKFVEEFSKPEYHVDVLKLEFPADIHYVKEYSELFGRGRKPVYGVKEVEDALKEMSRKTELPWVLLSAGVDFEEFLVEVEMASECGASGILAGRAIWKEAIAYIGDFRTMADFLSTRSVDYIAKLREATKKATPFWDRPKYKSFAEISIEGAGKDWVKTYR